MRLHIQNPPGDPHFQITPGQWRDAVGRHPDMGGIEPSFAEDESGFRAAMAEAEVLVAWTREADRLRPPGGLRAIAPRLRILSFTSAGVDKLLPLDWVPEGVSVLNNSGTHGEKAGEYGIMAILMIRNHVPFFAEAAREGRWAPRFASTLAGRTVGVLGMGTLGAAVARHARHFGARVIGIRSAAAPHPDADEHAGQDELERVLLRCDVLVVACPLTDRTRGLVSRDNLSRLPRGAGVVNIARGAVWDQDAACDLLEAGHLAACVTDVAVPEPLPADHRLWRTPGMFVTPHMSSDDPDTYNDRTLDILFANLRAEREGRALPNRIDPAKGY